MCVEKKHVCGCEETIAGMASQTLAFCGLNFLLVFFAAKILLSFVVCVMFFFYNDS
jgi:hypothetical protein